MKRFIYMMVLLLFCTGLFAQKDLFIFIQQPSGQPFYVRMGEKSFSSSSGGHIILGGLHDSAYSLYVGFPKNIAPEQMFTVALQRSDRGFDLKNINGQWQLIDQLSKEPIRASDTRAKGAISAGSRKDDAYSQLMAGVVDDTAVLYTGAEKNAVANNEPEKAKDTMSKAKLKVKDQAAPKAVMVKETAAAPPRAAAAAAPADIVRLETENLEEGKMLIYVDRTAAVSDTIRIVIPRL